MISSNISFLFSSFSSVLIIVFILFDFYLVHCSNTPPTGLLCALLLRGYYCIYMVFFFFASDDSCITSLFSSIAIIIITTTVVLDFSLAYAFNCGYGFFFNCFYPILLSMLTVESYLMNL